jgi:hypothetical protein
MRRKTANYAKNRKNLIRLLGSVSLPPDFTTAQRALQLEGVLPEGWNIHHCMPKSQGGTNRTENLAVMPKEGHDYVTERIKHVLESADLKEVDRPYLKKLATDNGGYTMDDVRLFSLMVG